LEIGLPYMNAAVSILKAATGLIAFGGIKVGIEVVRAGAPALGINAPDKEFDALGGMVFEGVVILKLKANPSVGGFELRALVEGIDKMAESGPARPENEFEANGVLKGTNGFNDRRFAPGIEFPVVGNEVFVGEDLRITGVPFGWLMGRFQVSFSVEEERKKEAQEADNLMWPG